MTTVGSTVRPEDVAAIKAILKRLAGTDIEPTGDIVLENGDTKYVFKEQSGTYEASIVKRES